MDIRSIEVFVAVAHERSLTHAAERLNLTQPALGQRIKNLQIELGITLFRRSAKGMELTDKGAQLLQYAESLLLAKEEIRNKASSLRGALSGQLRIGTIVDPEFIRLGIFLNKIIKFSSGIKVTLMHGMSGVILNAVDSGICDVGYYLALPEQLGPDNILDTSAFGDGTLHKMHYSELTKLKYKVVAPAGWHKRVAGAAWTDLAILPWIVTPPNSVHNRLLTKQYGKGSSTGLEQKAIACVDLEASMIDLVRSGAGLSLMREHIALGEAQSNGLVIVDNLSLDCALIFFCRAANRKDRVVDSAIKLISQIWQFSDADLDG